MTQKVIPASGNYAVALAVQMARTQIVAAYQITPSTATIEHIARMWADGKMGPDFHFVNCESEHTAMSVLSAAAPDARCFTATSGNGLTYMNEVLRNPAANATPLVMEVANRSPGGPINIWFDYQDLVSVQDCGWVQIMTRNAQEAFDKTIMAFKIGENPLVQTPVMVNVDGFVVSNTIEPISIPEQEEVDSYLPPFKPGRPIFCSPDDDELPRTFGPMLDPQEYLEHKRNQTEQLNVYAKRCIRNEFKLFERYFGRKYEPVDTHRLEDADIVIVCAGSDCDTVATIVDTLRSQDIPLKPGMLGLGVHRPFFGEEVAAALAHAKAVAVLDRSPPLGTNGGAFHREVACALQRFLPGSSLPLVSVIGGLGGSQIDFGHIRQVFDLLSNVAQGKRWRDEPYWIGVDEDPIFVTEKNAPSVSRRILERYIDVYRDNQPDDTFYVPAESSTEEVAFHGRGGQGSITASNMIASAAINAGYKAAIIPTFGATRRGMPVKAVLKFGFGEFNPRISSHLYSCVIILDESLVDSPGMDLVSCLVKNGSVLVNTSTYHPSQMRRKLGVGTETAVYTLDGPAIAAKNGLRFYNMAIVGAFHRINKSLDFKTLLPHYKENLPGKTEEERRANYRILLDGYDSVQEDALPRHPIARDATYETMKVGG